MRNQQNDPTRLTGKTLHTLLNSLRIVNVKEGIQGLTFIHLEGGLVLTVESGILENSSRELLWKSFVAEDIYDA